jgi:glutamyl-tRNA synthetase
LSALAITRKRAGLSTDYDRTCLTVSPTESSQRAADGESHVIRLKVPNQYPAFHDAVYGTVEFAENKKAHLLGSFEDPVLLKSDGLPTYHLANVVDDHFMEITHVLRATEWLPSTPKHVWLYECFGWKKPEFVHVGLLQNDQRGKLSKRNGDVFVSEYREKGYLPEALVNFVALLGWSHTKTEDMMTLEEMVQEFDIDRLTQGNQIVNFGKLDFLQKHHAAAAPQGGETEKAILARCEKFVAEKFGDKFVSPLLLSLGAHIT